MGSERRLFFSLALILFLAAVLFLGFVLVRQSMTTGRAGRLFSPRRSSASWSVLEEIRNMEKLETASFQMKAVFPYDFTDGESVDWNYLKTQYDYAPLIFKEKSRPEGHAAGVLPARWKHAQLYAMCREAGIDPARPRPDFIVLTVKVEGGVDLAAWRARLADAAEKGAAVSEEDGRTVLHLPLPPVSITSFSVADRDNSQEGFPDVALSPEEWGILVRQLEPELREMAMQGGLPERAMENSRHFLREIFLAAGYDDVVFSGK